MFPTQETRVVTEAVIVSIPSNRGGVSYPEDPVAKIKELLESQSPRIGAVFPTLTLSSRVAQGPVDTDPGISPLK